MLQLEAILWSTFFYLTTPISFTQASAPTVSSLSVSSVSEHSLTVSWGAPTGPGWEPTTYKVEISTISNFLTDYTNTFYVDSVNRTFTFTGLSPCALYYVSVQTWYTRPMRVWSRIITNNSYTAPKGDLVVSNLRVPQVRDGFIDVSWDPPVSQQQCLDQYLVIIRSSVTTTIKEYYTTNYHLSVKGLEACTLYTLSVTVVLKVGSRLVPSTKSESTNVTTTPGTGSYSVSDIRVYSSTSSSMLVTWERPISKQNCVNNYFIMLKHSENTWHDNTTELFYNFTGLEPCSAYEASVVVNYSHLPSSTPKTTRGETIAEENAVVRNLTVSKNWTSLEVSWRPPYGDYNCVPWYLVQVRDPQGKHVRSNYTRDTVHKITELRPCIQYSVFVTVSITGNTTASDSASQLVNTTGVGPMHFNKRLEIKYVTLNSFSLKWYTNPSCKYVNEYIATVEKIIPAANRGINVTYRFWFENKLNTYTVNNLEFCQKYRIYMELVNIDNITFIQYETGETTTEAPADLKIKDLKTGNMTRNFMAVSWGMDDRYKACNLDYNIAIDLSNGSSRTMTTQDTDWEWMEDVCKLRHVSVTPIRQGVPVGTKSSLDLDTLTEVSGVRLSVGHVTGDSATVVLIAPEGRVVCLERYTFTVSWAADVIAADGDVSSTTKPKQADQPVTLHQLAACSNYSVQASIQTESRTINLNDTFQTGYKKPKLDVEFKYISRGFNVSWSFSDTLTRPCMSRVMVRATRPAVREVKEVNITNKTYAVITNLVPCREYTLYLDAFGTSHQEERIQQKQTKTRVQAERIPIPCETTVKNYTKNSAMLEFNATYKEENDCPVTKVETRCQSKRHNATVTMGGGFNLIFPIRVDIRGLKVNTTYNCTSVIINSAGDTISHVSFSTMEGVPSQPKGVMVTSESNSMVRVSWSPPDQEQAAVLNYTVMMKHFQLKHLLAPDCPPPARNYRVVVDHTVTKIEFVDLPADGEFKVVVRAASAVGYGPYSVETTGHTPPKASGPVRDLLVEKEGDEMLFTWRAPCVPNGDLSHFLIVLEGSRENHHTANHNITRNVVQGQEENYSANILTSALTAEAKYNVIVIPVSIDGALGENQTKTFLVAARLPPVKADYMAYLKVEPAGPSSALVTLRSGLFPDTEGRVLYYAILVAENNFTAPPAAGALPGAGWPTENTWAQARARQSGLPYQATPCRWQPFKGDAPSEVAVFVLGLNTSCNAVSGADGDFCNGPLKAATRYALRARGFTAAGYRDSHYLVFQTDEIPPEGSTTFVTVLVILVILVTVSYVGRRQIKGVIQQKVIGKIRYSGNKSKTRNGLKLSVFLRNAEALLKNEDHLREEFKKLEDSSQLLSASQAVARLPGNKKKNRYANILPYDKNRVVIIGDQMDDYINASHILINSTHYIACQGPKESECGIFWKMIMQNEVRIIVMLCMPMEKGREKCFPYFPVVSGEEHFNGITVVCTSETIQQNYIVRNLQVKKGDISEEVIQFHYTAWPDFGVPNSPESLVEFIQAVRRSSNQGHAAIAVHCSAGVGRTGTFIAVDALLSLSQTWDCTLDVLQTVLTLRQQRCSMVQTEEQYGYIYKCLHYAMEKQPPFIAKVRKRSSTSRNILKDLSRLSSIPTSPGGDLMILEETTPQSEEALSPGDSGQVNANDGFESEDALEH